MVAKEEGGVFDTLKYGGILGLAFEHMAAPGMRGLITQAMEEGTFHGHNQMSFYFTTDPLRLGIRSGAYFGGVNPELYTREPQCMDVRGALHP